MKINTSDPLINKYASVEIVKTFSDDNRYNLWRSLWISLAKAEKEAGLDITDEQINEMMLQKNNINFTEVARIEKELSHDVMAHLHHFGNLAPKAKGIMHLGATSEFIKDNTDLILIKNALNLIEDKLIKVITSLVDFALKYKDLPTLSFTHYQVAQPTTVGRRACMWLQSFYIDLQELNYIKKHIKFRGIKGTTGTLASFKELFKGDYEKVKSINDKITKEFGFEKSFIITGQTYDRKFDISLLNCLSAIAVSSHKITNDIRLLQNLKELEEGFGKNQIGSSAMPYKKNPIKCERISSLAKYLMTLPISTNMVASTQWLERTLDDSANRRITIPNAFYTADAILSLLNNIIENLQVNIKVINKNINAEIPFLATENIMMFCVKKGGDRQNLHEKIRQYSIQTKKKMIEEGTDNNLLEKILNDKDFHITKEELKTLLNVDNFIGFSKEQVNEFTKEVKGYIKNLKT